MNPSRSILLVPVVLAVLFDAGAWAGPTSRTVFPGRRVGGGTRGDCTSRQLAHLVPASSEFSPGSDGLIGLIEGQTETPRAVTLTLKPRRLWESGAVGSGTGVRTYELSPQAASVRLMRIGPVSEPLVWESTYRCGTGASTGGDDPLAYIQSVAPPALSLLQPMDPASVSTTRRALQKLAASCATLVPRQQILEAFDLQEMVRSLPEQVPVICE